VPFTDDHKPAPSFTLHQNEVDVDFRDSGEVWLWLHQDDHVMRLDLTKNDVHQLLDDMTYLFHMEEAQNMLEEMNSDPMSDAVGYHPDLAKGPRDYLYTSLVRRLERQSHYLPLWRAKELIDEVLDA